jgi:O-antigen ligase
MTAGPVTLPRATLPQAPRRAGITAVGAPATAFVAALVAVAAGPMYGLAVIGAIGVLVSAVRAPGIILAAYLLIPYYKGGVQPYLPLDITLILAVFNIAQVIPLLRERQQREISGTGVMLWFAFAALVLAGVMWAPDKSLATSAAGTYWILVALPMVPAAIRVGSSERHLRQLLWCVFAFACLVAVLGLAGLSASDRLVVLGANTINVARAVLLVPVVGLTLLARDRMRGVWALLAVMIPAALLVAIASGSRGPLLVLIALGIAGGGRYLWQHRGLSGRVAGGLAVAAVVSIVAFSVVADQLPESSLKRFQLLGDFAGSGLSGSVSTTTGDISAGVRVTLFGVAISMFQDRPLLGMGTAGFQSLSPRYASPLEADAYPHNAILQIAAEFGLPGLFLFGSLIVLAIRRPLGPSHAAAAVRAIFLFFLLNSMVSGDVLSDRETLGPMLLLLCIDAASLRATFDARIASWTVGLRRPGGGLGRAAVGPGSAWATRERARGSAGRAVPAEGRA